ncbi:MAG: ferredoxin family protein [Bryobacteraceae bacterium]|jgi:ferredoxin
MAYVITDTCVKDELCVDICPVDCIHPKRDEPDFEGVPQLYIDPDECIDCGACVPACPADAIFAPGDLPVDLAEFQVKNKGFYACRNLGRELPAQ